MASAPFKRACPCPLRHRERVRWLWLVERKNQIDCPTMRATGGVPSLCGDTCALLRVALIKRMTELFSTDVVQRKREKKFRASCRR